MKKNLLILPIIWLVLGAVAIATEIKTSDFFPLGQQLSGSTMTCIKTAVEAKETALLTAATVYQNGYILALTTKKNAVLAAWEKSSKKEIKWALGQAAKTYKTTLNILKKSFKNAEKTAKIVYKTDTKACKSTGIQELIDIQIEVD